ncbi:hypothetical protein ACOMHN_016121 [Nucella lapillus]
MTTQGTQTDWCPAAAPTYAEVAARSPPAAPKTAQKEKDFLYIGSSVNLRHRWSNHKSDCKLRKGHKCHVAQHFLDKQHPVDPQFTCLRIFAIEAVHKKENLGWKGRYIHTAAMLLCSGSGLLLTRQ